MDAIQLCQLAQQYRWRGRNPRDFESQMAVVNPFSLEALEVVNVFLGRDGEVDYRIGEDSWSLMCDSFEPATRPAGGLVGRNESRAWEIANKVLCALIPETLNSPESRRLVFSATAFLRLVNPRRFPILATVKDLLVKEPREWQTNADVLRDYRIQAMRLQRIAIRLDLQDPAGLDDALYVESCRAAGGQRSKAERLDVLRERARGLQEALSLDDQYVGMAPKTVKARLKKAGASLPVWDIDDFAHLMDQLLPEGAVVQEVLAALATVPHPRFVKGLTELMKTHLATVAKTMVQDPGVDLQVARALGVSRASLKEFDDRESCIRLALTAGKARGKSKSKLSKVAPDSQSRSRKG